MAKYKQPFWQTREIGSQLKFWLFSEKSHQNNKYFLSRSSPDPPIFKKVAVRSSPDPAKIGFSPDPVRSSPDPR